MQSAIRGVREPNINACCCLLSKSKDSMIVVFGIMYATMQICGKDVCTPRKRRYGTMGHEVLKGGEQFGGCLCIRYTSRVAATGRLG
jgi:hypothetical protein